MANINDKLVLLSIRVTPEQREYLNEMAWRNRTSLKDYVTELIQEDMEKNPNWKQGIDKV